MTNGRRVVVAALVPLIGLIFAGCVRSPQATRTGIGDEQTTELRADPGNWGAVTDEPAVTVARVEGVVHATATVEVRSPVDGRIISAPVRRGSPVTAGDPIVVVQPTSPSVEALQAAAVALDNAVASGATEAEVEQLLAARAEAAAAVEAEAGQSQPAPLTLVAPVDGVVVSAVSGPGAPIAAGALAVSLGATSQLEVQATVPFDLFESFAAGEPIKVVGRSTSGSATAASLFGPTDRIVEWRPEERTAIFRIGFDETPTVSDGDRVFVETAAKIDDDLRSIPTEGLREFGGQAFVLVRADRGLRRVEVNVVRQGNQRVEIRGPLALGDLVWLL